jgi:hypothetical protein
VNLCELEREAKARSESALDLGQVLRQVSMPRGQPSRTRFTPHHVVAARHRRVDLQGRRILRQLETEPGGDMLPEQIIIKEKYEDGSAHYIPALVFEFGEIELSELFDVAIAFATSDEAIAALESHVREQYWRH